MIESDCYFFFDNFIGYLGFSMTMDIVNLKSLLLLQELLTIIAKDNSIEFIWQSWIRVFLQHIQNRNQSILAQSFR